MQGSPRLLRAATASTEEDLSAARDALERAVAINPEETGAPMVLAEITLVGGELNEARQRLERIRQTNPGADDDYEPLGLV